jgi:hypothetical protein
VSRSKPYESIRERRFQAVLKLIRDYFGNRAFTSQDVRRQLQAYGGDDPVLRELSQFQILRVRRLLQRLVSRGDLLEAKGAGRSSNIYRLAIMIPGEEPEGKQAWEAPSIAWEDWERLLESHLTDGKAQIVSLATLMKSLQKREIAILKELSQVRGLMEQCELRMQTLLHQRSSSV